MGKRKEKERGGRKGKEKARHRIRRKQRKGVPHCPLCHDHSVTLWHIPKVQLEVITLTWKPSSKQILNGGVSSTPYMTAISDSRCDSSLTSGTSVDLTSLSATVNWFSSVSVLSKHTVSELPFDVKLWNKHTTVNVYRCTGILYVWVYLCQPMCRELQTAGKLVSEEWSECSERRG